MKYYTQQRSTFDRKVAQVHDDIINELKTNSTGHIGRRYKKLGEDLEGVDLFDPFPLECYLSPTTSPADDSSQGWPGFGKGEAVSGRGKARNIGRGDLEGMARACERYFEWGTREIVCKKFASDSVNLFGAEIVVEARGATRAAAPATPAQTRPTLRPGQSPDRITSYFSQRTISTAQGRKSMSTTSSTHIVKIHGTRPSPVCPELTEYRLEYRPQRYIDRCRDAMDGHRADPSTLTPEERAALGMVSDAVAPADTTVKDEVRIWIADYLVRAAWPDLITKYEEELAAKAAKKAAPKKKASAATTGRKKAPASSKENPETFVDYFTHPPPTQSAVREVQLATQATQESQRRSRSASASSASSALTPAPSSPAYTPFELSRDPSSFQTLPISPVNIVSSSPSPPASPSKRGRAARSQTSSSRSSSVGASSEASTPSVSHRRSPRKKRVTPPRAPPRAAREVTTTTRSGTAEDPISIESSDDEVTPRPLRTSIVVNALPTPTRHALPSKSPPKDTTGSSRARATAAPIAAAVIVARPPPSRPPASSATPTRTVTTQPSAPASTQSRLDSMIVARAHKRTPKTKTTVPTKDTPPIVSKPTVPYYIVSEDEDGVEHIDLTQRRKRT